MAEVIWTEPALEDINALAEYIARTHAPYRSMGKRVDNPHPPRQCPPMAVLMNRRSFLGNAIAGLAASGILTQMRGWAQATTNDNGLSMPIGFQSYVFRE